MLATKPYLLRFPNKGMKSKSGYVTRGFSGVPNKGKKSVVAT